jgi:N-acetylglucosamine-6-phosphate deacetylase
MDYIIKGATICTPEKLISNGAVIIRNGKISQILDSDSPLANDLKIVEFSPDHTLLPGFIDMHMHGSNGADVMDATPEALQTIADSVFQNGTTGFLASTMTETIDRIEAALINIREFVAQQNQKPLENTARQNTSRLLGIHLEGPFLSKSYMGAQQGDLILSPDLKLFNHWQKISGNLIKMITLAPEEKNGMEFVRTLHAQGIIVSFGHSAANYAECNASIDAGVTHATHLFNAMRGIHHREPGAVTALLLRDEVYAELIADGKHVADPILQLAYDMKGADKLVLVTDAIRAQCLPDGISELGGQVVIVKDRTARLENGALAGSIVTLPEALQHMRNATNCSLLDLSKMASTNPATELKLPHDGSIKVGNNANFAVLDKNYKNVKTFIN